MGLVTMAVDVGTGILIGIVGGGLAVYGLGRIGPEQQAACCGCSCVVALIALPVSGLVFWGLGGPLEAFAAIPAWIPLLRLLDWVWSMGYRASEELRRRSGA